MSGARRRATVALPLAGAIVVLTACSSGDAGGIDNSRQAYDALRALGVECVDPQVDQPPGFPYRRIGCEGLQIEWIDDRDAYEALWKADCAAVPPERRASMEAIVLLRGSSWVVRGNGEGDINAWPAGIAPAQAAQAIGGQVMTAGDVCRALGAWPAGA